MKLALCLLERKSENEMRCVDFHLLNGIQNRIKQSEMMVSKIEQLCSQSSSSDNEWKKYGTREKQQIDVVSLFLFPFVLLLLQRITAEPVACMQSILVHNTHLYIVFNEICNSSWFLWTIDWLRQRLKTFRHIEYKIPSSISVQHIIG